ncbi:hypothetical protein A176_005917 [Myxococcus hansupus]|uniref:Uncharacterized protein n=1 Tax=Pseudomyxococcus hansupus TaxID=1297742 RepID=A0A0H4X612_9BACT|nr:hypothetical protein [Myxococcus hansupus]AKQ69005.1 hypothetical protein A176_005917 [Myxococcus hansupus]
MLSLIAVALLATTPSLASHSLLTPSEGRAVSARLLVAQAPETEAPEVDVPSDAPALRQEDLDARARELTLRISKLQSEIRTIDTNWPTGSMVMAYSGYVLAPLLLLGIPLIIYGVSTSNEDNRGALVALGTGLSVGGAAGVGLLVAGIITGSRGAAVNRAHREQLVNERIQLEDELRDVKARRDARGALQTRTWTPRPSVPLVAFAF